MSGDPKLAVQALIYRAAKLGVAEDELRLLRQKLLVPKVKASVIALIKAGKSSFLNATCHEELLPAAAQPATASITRIVHDASEPDGCLIMDDLSSGSGEVQMLRGREAIHSAIKSVNDERRAHSLSGLKVMELRVPIPVFSSLATVSDLEIVDTPGPNEHGADLEFEVMNVLEDTDVIFYLLDFTKLGGNDEAKMFDTLRSAVKPILESSSGQVRRIYYILNKVDCHSKRNDKTMPEILKDIAQKIQSLLPGIEVQAEDIIPISAQNALLARQLYKRQSDAQFLEDFLRKAMGECFEDDLEESEYLQAAMQKAYSLEKKSGFDVIERQVLEKVVHQKQAISLLSVCDRLKKAVTKLYNNKAVELGTSKATLEELQDAVSAMETTQANINKNLDKLQGYSEHFQQETGDQASSFFRSLSQDVERTITKIMDGSSESDGWWDSAAMKPFRWVVKSLMANVTSLESTNREELLDKLNKVNAEVTELLAQQMALYKHKINAAMLKQQHTLRTQLNKIVQPLLDHLKDEASQSLGIDLKCEVLDLPSMDLQEFQEETDRKMKALVQEKREKVAQTRNVKTTKHGACGKRWTETRQVTDFVTETTGYNITKEKLKEVYLEQAQNQLDVSKRSTELLIEREIICQVKNVQEKVQERSQDFANSLKAAMHHRLEEREQASVSSSRLEEALAHLQELLDQLDKAAEQFITAEGALPRSQELVNEQEAPVQSSDDLASELQFEIIESCSGSEPKNGVSPAAAAGAQ
eukprot:TRINITY_DN47787_c0_g1_i1.p1 TRINITY_DN47787_c0_g1~~TRINITY_DN47787_c0_g1_i1.p1  ORF type:complete len:848 (+),score=229.13 TRINITY_DN47787_c0_g1_i1:275-2545(+)